jgi:hypothetical protein
MNYLLELFSHTMTACWSRLVLVVQLMRWRDGKCFVLSSNSVSVASRYSYAFVLCRRVNSYYILQTNIPFLFRLLTHDVFIGGKTWTTVRFLSEQHKQNTLTPNSSS